MKLYIQRHGFAEPSESSDPKDLEADRKRRLTPEGKKGVAQSAVALRQRGERPTVILASPSTRCVETANIIAQTFGVPVLLCDALDPHQDMVGWLTALADDEVEAVPGLPNRRLYLVGHHDNIVPALAKLGDYDKDEVGPMYPGEVRKLKMKPDGDWSEIWRWTKGPDDTSTVTASLRPVAAISGRRA